MRIFFYFWFLLFIFYSNSAFPAVWTKKKGEGEILGLYSFSTNKPRAFVSGKKDERISYYSKKERKIYFENGITNNLTSGFCVENGKITIINSLDDIDTGEERNNTISVLTAGDFESIINNNFDSINSDSNYLLPKIEEFMDSIGITKSEFLALTSSEKQKIYNDFLDSITIHENRKVNQNYSIVKLFIRQKLLESGGFIMSLQPTIQFPLYNPSYADERVNFINTRNAYEFRLLSGYTFEYTNEKSIFNQYHFVNFEIAYNKIIDSFFDEIKFSFASGIRMNQNSFLLFEVFHTYNNCSTSKNGLSNPFKKANKNCCQNEGRQVYGIKPKNNDFLKTENTQVKLSSVIRFSDILSTQLSLMQTYTKFDTSSGIEIGFWFNI